jgi:hypothetical protein
VAKLLKYFARPDDALITASSDYLYLTPYAARRADGSLALLIINKSAANAYTANVTLNSFAPTGTVYGYSYGIPQDEAARTGVGSADIAQTSYAPPPNPFSFSFPAYSATVLVFNGTQPPTVRQPDNQIKLSNESTYLGDNVYNTDGSNQTKATTVRAGKSATFDILIQNDGSATDSFTVLGAGNSTGFTVKYYPGTSGGSEITSAVLAGTYSVNNLAPGTNQVFRAVITVARGVAVGTTKDCLVTSTSAADNTKRDAVKARVTVQ